MSCRHKNIRYRRKALKADCVVLLDKVMARYGDDMTDRMAREIAEIRTRLAPSQGVAAPIILTGYTKGKL